MDLSENYVTRMHKLAGIPPLLREDNVVFSAESGRSEKGTLSYYIESYLLSVASKATSLLDSKMSEAGLTLVLKKEETKIYENSLFVKFRFRRLPESKDLGDFSITFAVNFGSESNTVASVMFGETKTRLNLASKHSIDDVNRFIEEVAATATNLVAVSEN